jgi:hypothetical protein
MRWNLILTATLAISFCIVQFAHAGGNTGWIKREVYPEQQVVPVHESWISRQQFYDPSSGARCCNEHDCSALEDVEVREISGGFLIERRYFVTRQRVLPSIDGRYWACFNTGGGPHRMVKEVRCFFAPMST